ncbi:MAG: succinate dehydrogenase assembly factor 4 [Sneathiella sp.]
MTEKKTEIEPADKDSKSSAIKQKQAKGEVGGPKGLEPTRYGDWERKGIVSDF